MRIHQTKKMDADSSYGGSDTAQDSTTNDTQNTSDIQHDEPSDTTIISQENEKTNTTAFHTITASPIVPDSNKQFYHKNEITLPINYDEVDFQNSKLELKPPSPKLPHYMSTVNLNINESENPSNLENVTFSSTTKLNTESPTMQKKAMSGVDNPGFQQDEMKPNGAEKQDRPEKSSSNGAPKSAIDDKKPYNHSDLNTSVSLGLKSPSKEGDEQMPEAVNLELVNLKPLGGTDIHENGSSGTNIPAKKQTEIDIGESYDEYFVPVNEHRKYMRGEKLYVTMDKRTKRGCGKCFCWSICLIILIAVVVIGTLAGTGVILNNEVQPVSSESNKPRFFNGGALEVTTMANDKQQLETSTLDSNSNIPFFTPGPPISTVSSMLPTTETSMIQVPRALEGQIIIDNEEFTPGLGIHNSTEFKDLATKLEKQIKDALFDQFTQQYGATDINIKVTDFMPGSIVVKYRVGWEFKHGFHNTRDPLDVESLKTKLEDHLNQNSGYIDNFHISKETVTANKVLDMCQIDKNGCEYNCTFDYVHMDFMCVCPEGQILNEDGKTCKMVTEPDIDYPQHFDYEYDDKMIPPTTPEPHAEPEPTVTETHRHSHIFDTESENESHFITTTKANIPPENHDEESNTRRVITPETVISFETTIPPMHQDSNDNIEEVTTNTVYKDLVHVDHVDEFGKGTTTPGTHADYTNYELNTHNGHKVHIIEEEGVTTTAKISTFEHEPSSEPSPNIEPIQSGNDSGSIGTGRGFNIFTPVTTTVEPDSAAESTSEPEPNSTGEHHMHDEYDHDTSNHHDTTATTESIPAAEPEPTAEPSLDSTSETTSVHEPDTTSEPISAAEPTSSAEPNLVAEPDSSTEPISVGEPISVDESVSTAEPSSISEVKSTTVSVAESDSTRKNISIDEVDSNTEQNSAGEPDATAEPTFVTEPETTAEPNSVDEPIATAEPNSFVEHDSTSQTNNIVSISTSDSHSSVEIDTTTTPGFLSTNESDSTQLSHSPTEQNTVEHSSTIELGEQNHTTDEFNLVSESATTTQSVSLDTRKFFTSGSETESNQTNQSAIPTETTTMSSRDNRLLNMDSIDESTLNGTVHSYSVHEDVVDTTPAPPLIYTVGTETGLNNTETTAFPSHEHHFEENNVSGNEDTIEPITNEVITYKPDEYDNSIHEITSEENPNVTLDIQSNLESVTAIPHYITQLSSTTEQQNIDNMVTTMSTTDNFMNEDLNGLIHENHLNSNHEITTHTVSTTLRPSNGHSYEVYEANVESDPAEVTTKSPDQSIVTTEVTHLSDLHTGTEVPNLVDHKQETTTPNISTSSQNINVSEMNEMISTKEMPETSTIAVPMMNEAHDENDASLSVVPLEKQNKTADTYNTSDFVTETKDEDDHKTTTTSPNEQTNTAVEEITTHSTLVKEVPVSINSDQTSIEVTSSLNTVHDTETSKPLFLEKGRRLEDSSEQLVSVNINKENETIPTTIKLLSASTEIPTTSKALESETISSESEVMKNTTDINKTEEYNLETTYSVQNSFESEQTTTPMVMKDQVLGVAVVPTEAVSENTPVEKPSNLTENSIFDTPATKPPRLDNDEKNETNPIELNPPVNSTLTVVPLSEISSENSNEINVSTTDKFANIVLSTEKIAETTTEATSVATAIPNFTNMLEVHDSENQNIDSENTETAQSVTTVANNSIALNENTVFTTGNGENLVHTITEKVQPATIMDEVAENDTTTILPPRENIETTMNPVMTTTSSIPVIHGETVYTATETVVVGPEHFEPNTDYNDLLASSTENTDKVLQTKTQSENNFPVVEPETTTMNPVILREITSEKVTTVTKSVSAVINATNHPEDLNSISDIAEEKPVNVFENENDNDSLLSVVPLQKHTNEKKKTDVEKKLSKVYNKELQYEKNSKNDIDDLNKFEEDFVLDKFSRSSSSRAPEQNVTTQNMQEDLTELINNTFHSEEMVARNLSFDSADNTPTEENQTENVIANKETEDGDSALSKVDKFRNFSKCASGQFQCANGTSVKDGSYCITRSARCDSINDCSDGSDEVGCAEENCLDNFQCKSGQCLKRHLVCDGITNCDDASDELDCGSWECRFDEFSCGTGNKCIPLTWRCDGLAHCPDASDERACLHAHCGNQEYHCIEQDTCIPLSWRCDGKPDCMAGQDEKLCECSLEQFKCESGGCVSENQRCDGIDDCPDRSDEWNCVKIESIHDDNQTLITVDDDRASNSSKMFLQILSSNNKWHYVCSDNWNQTYSDITCQNLGYANSVYTEHTYSKSIKTDGGFLKLKETSNRNSKLLSMLEYVDYCDNVVSIACQEFICGNAVVSDTGSIQSQWPSVTLLYNKRRNTQCTASLITPSWVLVSYACIHSDMEPGNWILYAGGTHLDVLLNASNTQVSEVKTIVPHPQAKYMQFLFKNDAALIELTKPVNLAMDMNPVCIPEQNIDSRQVCVTAGWGINKPGESNLKQYLQYLPVPTIETDECNSTKHYNGNLNNDQICAGFIESEKSATCYNDEGAPLMCFNDNENAWELQGILSYHGNCGRKQHPAIYTAISADLKRWIANTVGDIAIMHKRKMFNV